jgi:hypothetical protein
VATGQRPFPLRQCTESFVYQEKEMSSADIESQPENDVDELSLVVVSLLKGVLYQEDKPKAWNSLLGLQAQVRDYLAVIGLDLVLDEAEGYAFLQSFPQEEGQETTAIPRLIRRPAAQEARRI